MTAHETGNRHRMNRHYFLTALIAFFASASIAHSDEMSECKTNAGNFLEGTIVKNPEFMRARERRHGIPLSHTHVTLQVNGQTSTYDVAIDNVFAADYDKANGNIPPSLESLKVGDILELCGKLYPRHEHGIHWVHTNCGQTPNPRKPNGWVKLVDQNGHVGPNLEGNEEYCYLW